MSDKCIVCKKQPIYRASYNDTSDMCLWCSMYKSEADDNGLLFVWDEVRLMGAWKRVPYECRSNGILFVWEEVEL